MNLTATGSIAGIDAATRCRAFARWPFVRANSVVGDHNLQSRNIIKAGSVALYFARVIEGSGEISADSDLSPSSTLTGQRSKTDERLLDWESPVGATSRSGGLMVPCQRKAKISAHHVHNLGNPCAEKVRPHRSRQLFL